MPVGEQPARAPQPPAPQLPWGLSRRRGVRVFEADGHAGPGPGGSRWDTLQSSRLREPWAGPYETDSPVAPIAQRLLKWP